MNNKVILVIGLLLFVMNSYAQDQENSNYRRSSLHVIMMEFDDYKDNTEKYKRCFDLVPFPAKYNKHAINDKYFKYNDYQFYIDNTLEGKNADIFNMESSISEFFDEKKIANQLVAKWFNRNPRTGEFSMDLIQERGLYDASETDKDLAKNTIRGVSMLADAGEELIGNTFIVVCRLRYISKEGAARTWTEGVKEGAKSEGVSDLASGLINLTADIFYNKTKDGYEVRTDAFLYKLKWNKDIADHFYNEYWINEGEIDIDKKIKFDKSNLFELEYVGTEFAVGKVLFSSKTKTPDRIIEIATVRNIDNVFTKLQKNYEVFKTKSPIITIDPLAAEIGLKEGLTKGDKFSVLETRLDEKTGKTEFIQKGSVTVGKEIWDNRYGADEDENASANENKFTIFKGSGNFYPGLLLKQIK